MLDLALTSGRSPVSLLDGDQPDVWQEIDLEIVSQWKYHKENKCTGCGRPLSQHLHNPRLGREETVDDYTAWTVDCPAAQALALGQEMWRSENKNAIEAFHKSTGPDPSMGVYWLSKGAGERLPTAES